MDERVVVPAGLRRPSSIDHVNGQEPAMATLRRLFEEGAELYICDVVVCEALSGEDDEPTSSAGVSRS